jgi:hypothetical protein
MRHAKWCSPTAGLVFNLARLLNIHPQVPLALIAGAVGLLGWLGLRGFASLVLIGSPG